MRHRRFSEEVTKIYTAEISEWIIESNISIEELPAKAIKGAMHPAVTSLIIFLRSDFKKYNKVELKITAIIRHTHK